MRGVLVGCGIVGVLAVSVPSLAGPGSARGRVAPAGRTVSAVRPKPRTVVAGQRTRPPLVPVAVRTKKPAPRRVRPPAPVTGQPVATEIAQSSDGALSVITGGKAALTNARVRMTIGGNAVTAKLQPPRVRRGKDRAGTYDAWVYPLGAGATAALEVRRYRETQAVVGLVTGASGAEKVELLVGIEGFTRGLAINRMKLHWTSPTVTSDYRQLGPANQLVLWQRASGADFHALVPLAADGMVGEVGASDHAFRVSVTRRRADAAPDRLPVFAYGAGQDPYALLDDTYRAAFAAGRLPGALREAKKFPRTLAHLGWGSWNAFYKDVDAAKVLKTVHDWVARGVPLRMVLVDDRSQEVDDDQATGFVDETKFPGGFEPLARALRAEGVSWVAVWHALAVYWRGVKPGSRLDDGRPFVDIPDPNRDYDATAPDPRLAGRSVYDDYYRILRPAGVDVVKVDNQARNGGLGFPFQRVIQRAARRNGIDIMNSMGMTLENVYALKSSTLIRNSDDYIPNDRQLAKEHVFQNAYNAVWTRVFGWPDYDFIDPDDPEPIHHVLRATGHSFYMTGVEGVHAPKVAARVATRDGAILALDDPAVVTRDLLLRDPSLEAVPLTTAGTVTRPGLRAGIIAAYHVNKWAPRVGGTVPRAELERVAGTAERLAVYRWRSGRTSLVRREDDGVRVELGDADADMLSVVRVERGVAVFGLIHKYLGPAGVASVARRRSTTTIVLREGGRFGAWVERSPRSVTIDGVAVPARYLHLRHHLLEIDGAAFPARGKPTIQIDL